MTSNPLIIPIDLDQLADALENSPYYADTDDQFIVPELVIDAARNWFEHCVQEQLRQVLGDDGSFPDCSRDPESGALREHVWGWDNVCERCGADRDLPVVNLDDPTYNRERPQP